jgi:F0F1-type ATP synthase assembly protein I
MMKKVGGRSKYFGFALSFGLTMALTVYLLFKGGQWLDNKLGTEPLFMMLGVLLAIGAVFKNLFAELKILERLEKKDREE